MMKYELVEEIVANCYVDIYKSKPWQKLLDYGQLGFQIAIASRNKLAAPTKEGEEVVEELYGLILLMLGLPQDVDYSGWVEINKIAQKQNGRAL